MADEVGSAALQSGQKIIEVGAEWIFIPLYPPICPSYPSNICGASLPEAFRQAHCVFGGSLLNVQVAVLCRLHPSIQRSYGIFSLVQSNVHGIKLFRTYSIFDKLKPLADIYSFLLLISDSGLRFIAFSSCSLEIWVYI